MASLNDVHGAGKILNIGAGGGVGQLVEETNQNIGSSVISLDIDPQKKPDIVCDVCQLPFKDSSFDCIVCAEVLEHVLLPHESIHEMYRVLKNGQTLILTTRFVFPLHGVRNLDYFRYTKHGLRALLSNFYKVEVREHLNWIETLALLLMRLLNEDKKWIKLLAIPIYLCGKCIDVLSKYIIKWVATDYITSGYLVLAKK